MKQQHFLLIGMILVFLTLISYRVTYALFSSTNSNSGNLFTAASLFPQTPPQEITPTVTPIEATTPTATPSLTPTPTISPIPTPAPITNLQINEFMTQPSIGDEWVEIINIGNTSINLTGWGIFDANNTRADDLALTGTITPGQILAFNHSAGWLNNAGDGLNLENNLGATVSAQTYASSSANVSIGRNIDGTGSFKNCNTSTKGLTNNGSC